MNGSDITKKRLGLTVFFGLVTGFAAIHVFHATGDEENIRTFVYGIFAPLVITVGLSFGGFVLWRDIDSGEYILRVTGWTVAGAIVMANTGVLTLLYEGAEGVVMADPGFVVVNAATGGAMVGFVIGFYDIRQQIARTEADELNRRLTVLNRVLRHDIRTKATTIRGNAVLLGEDTDSTASIAETIRDETADLVELGEYAKDLEKLFHEDDHEPETLTLTSIVAEQVDRLRERDADTDIEVSLRSGVAVTGHSLLPTAIQNVIENAVEHNDAESPHVEIDARTVTKEGSEWVEFRVADNGPGIPDTELDVLQRGFETDLEHMSGLGLWVVNWIVSASGGAVRFRENEPRGSVVILRHPSADSQ